MRNLDIASSVLLFIGAVTWGFLGLFGINLIDFFIENEIGDRFLYTLIGVAAIYRAVYYKTIRARWQEE